MKNKYGLPEDKLDKIRERDNDCVYCHKKMIKPHQGGKQSDFATIEHLNDLPPWDNIALVAFCCGSCNSSRGTKKITDWFKTKYCLERDINYNTVAKPIREYIDNNEKFLKLRENNKWIFAKTMKDIPHEYIIQDGLSKDDKQLFAEFKIYIDKNGYTKKFYSKEYKYIDIYGYKYWVIENILNRTKINRKKDVRYFLF